ncbi:MAG: AAA domain-containing protein [Chryseolinea sp.]
MADAQKNILSTYLRRLTNLSGNNRSLLLLKLHAEQLIDLHDLGFLNNEPSFEIINSLIASKPKKLCQVLDSRMEANNVVSRKLKKLHRIDKFIFDESGSNDLHVGWPFVRGKLLDGTLIRCPLLYFPVSLVEEGQYWTLQPRKDAGITLNKSFLLAFAFYNQVKLDEELIDTNFEEFDTDSTVFRTQLYQLLKDKIEINFNTENFRDTLTEFTEFKKQSFVDDTKAGELKLFPEAVLGIFPQAGSQLVPDYLFMMNNGAVSDLEDFFLTKNAGEIDKIRPSGAAIDSVSEENVYTPFVLDAYQENAIKAIKNGKSIVVQGPPGTGKSQLICNLLADAIASGKKALLVCQKRAALDVVYNRLEQTGLSDFLGLVHDFRNDRKEIYAKIAQQVEAIEDFKTQNRSVDVIQTERKFFQLCRKIDQIVEELEEFKFALFDDKESGVSVKELYLTSDLEAPSINLKQEYQYFPLHEVNGFLRRMKAYAKYAAFMEDHEYPWRERRSFSGQHVSDQREIEKVVSEIPAYQQQISRHVEQILGSSLNLEDCLTLVLKEDEILGMMGVLKDDETYKYFQEMAGEKDEDTSMLWLSNTERVITTCYDEDLPEVTLPTDQLGKFQDVLQQCMDARSHLIPYLKWELFRNEKFLVKRVLVSNDLNYNSDGLNALERKIDSRLNLEHQLTGLKEKSWLVDLPEDYDIQKLKTWFGRQKLAMRAKLVFSTLREITGIVNLRNYTRKEFMVLLRQLLGLIKDVPEKRSEWLRYLTPYQIRHIVLDPSKKDEYVRLLHRDFDSLCEYDRLKEEMKTHERDTIFKLHDQLSGWGITELEELFQNSVRLAWIDHLETKYPILRSVSSMKMEDLQQQLGESVEEKQKLSKEILLMRARERVYESLEYNRLNNLVTYRDLLHQVTKKKKIWPIRKLISTYYYELFQLIPCWMASPESVSAIFPMAELFDIVIFDEASQCFAERGLPSIFRGKQIVVAGDDKQLRPSELYQVRWDDAEENPDLEVDSLLELSGRYLSTVHLQGHYRSQSLELIDFSNTHFYEGRLQLLPDRDVLNLHEPAIEYQNVQGVWFNQTNEVEARAVVDRVLKILADHPEKEIGVVTFNSPQQMLILDLLENEAAVNGTDISKSMFVKNIENVQGDEKDIIIFSIGYAPDKQGKMAMQFGSLNTSGGENRLNVAVTRAREKIILITSIEPEQLNVSEIKNDGPKLLRKYLEFARSVDHKKYRPRTQIRSNQSADWYLSSRLKQWSKERMKDFVFDINSIPYSDISVSQFDQHLGVILTDDARYFASPSAKDVHAYTPALLRQRNWKYHMVFSRNLWKDRERVENDLMLFVGSQVFKPKDTE